MKNHTSYHQSVLLHEAIEGLAIKPGGIYVDATFGGGGHSRAILQQLNPQGRLFAFDQDADAWRNQPTDARLTPVKENFRYLSKFLRLHGVQQVDGILADLGVSSYQFDTAERGFSTRFEGPLDMRMDARISETAAQWLLRLNESELQQLFSQYGELRNARQLALHIVAERNASSLRSTQAFLHLIAPVVKGPVQKYHAQVFQALRMAVNDEMGALQDLLQQATNSLAKGGRLCVITFHSIEDRMVKQYMKAAHETEDLIKGNLRTPIWRMISPKPIVASEEEQKQNPRSRSAKLRIAEKI